MKKKTKKWFSLNIFKIILTLLAIILVGWIIFFSNIDLSALLTFAPTFLSGDDLNNFNQDPTGSCTYDIDKNTMCVGETNAGTLKDGINANCLVAFTFDGGEPQLYDTVDLGSDGEITISDSPGIAGTYVFGAYCVDEDGVGCRTNDETVIVEDCSTCTDTDGNNRDVPGHVTLSNGTSFYDTCIGSTAAVTEYTCSGNDVIATNLACDVGETCFETRSGGYCVVSEITYSDGDVIDSGSDSGDLVGGEQIIEEFDLGGSTGNCGVQATIETSWDYGNELCQGIQGMAGMNWQLLDSEGLAWSRLDSAPLAIGDITECNLQYDGETPFVFLGMPIPVLPSCIINYEYEVTLIACNCQD